MDQDGPEHLSKARTARTLSNLLRRDVIPHWEARSIHDIKKRDVIELIASVSERNGHAGHRTLKTLKTFFRWCVGRAVIEVFPAEGIVSAYREVSRDRVLSDYELAAIISSARNMPWPYGGIVEFLALTGQRREEVAKASPAEIDPQSRTWCIPGERTKNGKAHIVHLSEAAWIIIAGHLTGKFIFPTSTGRHFQTYSHSKTLLDGLCGIRGWRLHDLRRTIVSGMARMGIPPHVADKILNHQSGTISGVAAVYQRHDFLAERKEALDQWGAHVTDLVRQFKTNG